MLARVPIGSASNLENALSTAAVLTQVELRNLRPDGRGIRFTLGLKSELFYRRGRSIIERPPYTRTNRNHTRTVSAVCWHGHRDFMRRVYIFAPDTIFVTGIARWEDAAHFELNFEASGDRNIGSQVEPCAYRDACYCPESVEYLDVLGELTNPNRLPWSKGV